MESHDIQRKGYVYIQIRNQLHKYHVATQARPQPQTDDAKCQQQTCTTNVLYCTVEGWWRQLQRPRFEIITTVPLDPDLIVSLLQLECFQKQIIQYIDQSRVVKEGEIQFVSLSSRIQYEQLILLSFRNVETEIRDGNYCTGRPRPTSLSTLAGELLEIDNTVYRLEQSSKGRGDSIRVPILPHTVRVANIIKL